jgi:3D (Asp-Asp-Asp) domain-containing protein
VLHLRRWRRKKYAFLVRADSVRRVLFEGQSTRGWIAAFLSEGNENGSGVDRDNIEMQIESFCTGALTNCPAYNNRRYRHPGSLRTSCGNRPTVGTTVARNPNNTALACGSRVFIQGFGCRIVQDSGGGLSLDQLDMYQGIGLAACAGWPNPRRKTIKIN